MNHKCKEMAKASFSGMGRCVTYIYFTDVWVMSDGERNSFPIVCCPFCGDKLEVHQYGEVKVVSITNCT